MDGLIYLFALLGFLLVAKRLAGNRYENDCRRDWERKQAERRSEQHVSEKADKLEWTADELRPELQWERRASL